MDIRQLLNTRNIRHYIYGDMDGDYGIIGITEIMGPHNLHMEIMEQNKGLRGLRVDTPCSPSGEGG